MSVPQVLIFPDGSIDAIGSLPILVLGADGSAVLRSTSRLARFVEVASTPAEQARAGE